MPKSLEEIMADRDVAPVEQSRPDVVTDADRAANPIGAAQRERDEQGRFARQEQQNRSEPQDEPEGDEPEAQPQRQPGNVPPQALAAERQKRKQAQDTIASLQREMAELRGAVMARQQPAAAQPEPKAPPVFWENPEEAMDYRLRSTIDPVQKAMTEQAERVSRIGAVVEHGAPAVQEAEEAARTLFGTPQGQHLAAVMQQTGDVYGTLVRWHKSNKQQQLIQKMGDDPEAYIAAEIERRMAEQQPHDTRPSPAPERPRLPSSFAGMPSGGPRGGQGYGGPRALSDFMPRG